MNAIILAAGLGTRLRPLTNDRPKCMVEVCGTPMVERQIQCLNEIGVTDITLVSGYKAESLDYLKDKYGVDIVLNPKYDTANNIYSMYVVRERFGDTYVLEGDVYIQENCLLRDIRQSTYFSVVKQYENEWGLETDGCGIVKRVHIGRGEGPIMSGVSYWTRNDAEQINRRLVWLVEHADITKLFWDNAVIDSLPSLGSVCVRIARGLHEIDTVAELTELEKFLKGS